MMPAWYNRMNPRERVLSWVVAGTIFVLLNLWILNWILGALGVAHKEVAARRAKLAEQALYVKERVSGPNARNGSASANPSSTIPQKPPPCLIN